ncbi:MAG: hypothetical protein KKA67_07055 [Spirochaetes bacterium]|nr:hypothetical protein [Spirochaetota bacterium]MBU1079950.1 hypothetical protein [Spirochaetota bacterium]
MLYCCITIDYLSQLERSGALEAGAIIEELRSIAAAFGASAGQKKSPLVITLPTGSMFDGVQAAEAIRRMVKTFGTYESRLRGATLVVHDADSPEDALAYAARARYGQCDAYSYSLSPQAKAALSDYFDFQGDSWSPPLHETALADADAARLFHRPRLEATLERAIAKSGRSGPRLVHLEAGPGARSVEALAEAVGLPEESLLVLSGGRRRPIPFSPLVEAISARAPSPTAAGGAEAIRFVTASSFSGGAPESVAKGCAAYIDAWLDGFGESGGIVACDGPGGFSPEAAELIARRLSGGRGTERYLSIADGGLIDGWSGPWAARVPAGLADADDRKAAVRKALGDSSGAAGDALLHRFRAVSGIDRDSTGGSSCRAALGALPREAGLYLYALAVAENELSVAELSEFTGGLGLRAEGERLLKDLLARAGLVEPVAARTPIPLVDALSVAEAVGRDNAEAIQRLLSKFLIGLYRGGRIRPSLGFLSRVGELETEERLLYDCLFEEVTRPDRPPVVDPSFLSPSSASVYRFWSALTSKDRSASEAAGAAIEERVSGPRAQAVKALARAELAYSIGDPERASKGARESMLAMGKGAPPRLEARSQRMMGLSALALDKHTEAADYLTNAQELSETAGDDYERMMAAFAKAGVEFISGALVKAAKAANCAEESAARLFRMDALAAIAALRGRIDLELGAYDEAARRFSSISEIAREYGMPGTGRRATIWRARALAFAGEYDEAVAALEDESSDAEARAFRGELEILRGRPREARAWLDSPEEPAVRAFAPPDSFEWDSLFSEFEGRCIGFGSANAPLADFRTALSLFAKGLDERDPACASELHAMTRSERGSKNDPGVGTYGFFCYLLEERLADPPVDKQTVLSRAFKILQQRAGRIEDRAQRALYMEKNAWNKRLMEAARTHKFI